MKILHCTTISRIQMLPITLFLRELIREHGWRDGALVVFCPHTTAALTLNENADPDVQHDMCSFLNMLVPRSEYFLHSEGNSDAHIKSSLFGQHVMVLVEDGEIRLGAWQGVYLCEWDGPRSRTVWVQFLPA